MTKVIVGLTLIKHTGRSRINEVDDARHGDFRLALNFSPPQMMEVTFSFLFGGTEEIVVRARTRAAIDEFVTLNNFKTHPRLRHGVITGPDNLNEKFEKELP